MGRMDLKIHDSVNKKLTLDSNKERLKVKEWKVIFHASNNHKNS